MIFYFYFGTIAFLLSKSGLTFELILGRTLAKAAYENLRAIEEMRKMKVL